jgi:hypothetical protein
MDPFTIMLAGGMILQGFMSYKSGEESAEAIRRKANYQRHMTNLNKYFSERSAEDALERGGRAVSDVRKKERQVIGEQRAAMAAQGVNVSDASSVGLLDETKSAAAFEALTVENNAWREAWGYKVQGFEASMKGQLMDLASDQEARETLTTGGMQFVDSLIKAGGKFNTASPSSQRKSSSSSGGRLRGQPATGIFGRRGNY